MSKGNNKSNNKGKKRKINFSMAMVEELKRWQKENGCDLRPTVDKEKCVSCENYKTCHHYRMEREKILKDQEAIKSARARSKRASREEVKEERANDLINETIYPCEPYDFACPNRTQCYGVCLYQN